MRSKNAEDERVWAAADAEYKRVKAAAAEYERVKAAADAEYKRRARSDAQSHWRKEIK